MCACKGTPSVELTQGRHESATAVTAPPQQETVQEGYYLEVGVGTMIIDTIAKPLYILALKGGIKYK